MKDHGYIAKYGIDLCQKKFSQGSINKVSVIGDLKAPNQNILTQLKIFELFRATCKQPSQHIQSLLLFNLLEGAFCGEMAVYTKEELLSSKNCGSAAIELVSLDGHNMLVIGRPPDSAPNDHTTWGEIAVICDPWAQKYYTVSEFLYQQAHADKIPFVSDFHTLTIEEDYLKGNLKEQ